MNKSGNVCRLCLKTTSDNYLTITDETEAEISDVFFLFLNYSISDNPVMCKDCEKNLQNAIAFKTSRKIIPSLYSNVDMNNLNQSSADIGICHFCIANPTQRRYLPEVRNNIFLSEILYTLNTELKILTTEDPAACEKCFSIVQGLLRFTATCLNVEDKIMRYVEVEGTNDNNKISLSDVQVFLNKSAIKWDSVDGDGGTDDFENEVSKFESKIKVEEGGNSITLTVEDLMEGRDSDMETENLAEHGDEGIHIKNEEIEIKSEENFKSNKCPKPPQKRKMFACELCSYTSDMKHCLLRHMLIHQSDSEVELFRCPKCPFSTKYKCGLSRHMITHQDAGEAKIYRCQLCPFQTKHKYGTVKHALVHKSKAEAATFQCWHCDRKFKRKQQLAKHVLTHMKASLPKHRCDVCGYETIWKDNLATHRLVHADTSEVARFRCDLCPYEAKMKATLRQHVETHRNEELWHRCTECKYRSKLKGNLQKHLRLKHDVYGGGGSS